MKRCIRIVLVLVMIFIFNSNVCATSGALAGDTIKTCPDGIVYGEHGLNSSNPHWHVAKSCNSKSGWCPDGDALPGDPCPSDNKNTTRTAHNNVVPVVVDKQEIKSSNNTNGNNEPSITKVEETTTITTTETTTTTITSKETNKLKPQLLSLYVNKTKITFNSSNKGNTSELYGTNMIALNYKLNSSDFTLKVYDKLDNEITNIDAININIGSNEYKLVVSDKEGNTESYYLSVDKLSFFSTAMCCLLVAIIFFLLPVLFIKFIINKIKRK